MAMFQQCDFSSDAIFVYILKNYTVYVDYGEIKVHIRIMDRSIFSYLFLSFLMQCFDVEI